MPREYQNLKIQLIPTAAANVLIEEGFEKLGYSQDMLSSVGLFLLASCSGLFLKSRLSDFQDYSANY